MTMRVLIARVFIKIAEWILKPHYVMVNPNLVDLDQMWADMNMERTNLIEKIVVHNQIIERPEA